MNIQWQNMSTTAIHWKLRSHFLTKQGTIKLGVTRRNIRYRAACRNWSNHTSFTPVNKIRTFTHPWLTRSASLVLESEALVVTVSLECISESTEQGMLFVRCIVCAFGYCESAFEGCERWYRGDMRRRQKLGVVSVQHVNNVSPVTTVGGDE